MTVQDVARACHCSTSLQAYRLILNGALNFKRINPKRLK